jgi:phage host-nuclease inhibitor protein Gam
MPKTSKNPSAESVDQLLGQIARAQLELTRINYDWDAAIQELERQYGEKAKEVKQRLAQLEKQLNKEAKAAKGELFRSENDRLELTNGALIYSVSQRVKRAKAVTPERLEELGYTDGVRIEKRVKWEALESWPEEKLIAVGTERVRKENIDYETKESAHA